MTDHEVEQFLGCTPCVCGDLETWHPRCYVGLTKEAIAAGYKRAFAKARREIKSRIKAAITGSGQEPTP